MSFLPGYYSIQTPEMNVKHYCGRLYFSTPFANATPEWLWGGKGLSASVIDATTYRITLTDDIDLSVPLGAVFALCFVSDVTVAGFMKSQARVVQKATASNPFYFDIDSITNWGVNGSDAAVVSSHDVSVIVRQP